ncbi:MAG: hypothetical protein WKF97_24510 [Chitinophagaceae bacterium]
MATLNFFFSHILPPAPAHRVGNFIEMFNVKDYLLSKGFEESSESLMTETLINPSANKIFDIQQTHTAKPSWDFIELFNLKEVRNQIKKMIFESLPSTHPTLSHYYFECSELNQNRFSKTLELLLAYLSVKELKALSASFGVKIKNAPNGGDFDCIANFRNELVYFEAKSGNVRNLQQSTIQSFLDRHYFLAPQASILFLDFEGGEDKLDELIVKFKNKSIGLRSIEFIRKVIDGTKKFYVIESDILIVDIHNDGNILSNLRLAMQYLHRYNAFHKNTMHNLIKPEYLGYKSIVL